MTSTLSARAASLTASAALLGAAVFAALSVSFTINRLTFPDPPGIVMVPEPLLPPVVEPPAQPHRPQAPLSPLSVPLPLFTPPPLLGVPDDDSGAMSASPGPVMIENPRWLRRPSGLDRYYPRRARESGIEGAVQLDCLVSPLGVLRCAVISETPANWGFGAAALRIAGDYRMAPALRDGAATEGRYRMRIPFQLN